MARKHDMMCQGNGSTVVTKRFEGAKNQMQLSLEVGLSTPACVWICMELGWRMREGGFVSLTDDSNMQEELCNLI